MNTADGRVTAGVRDMDNNLIPRDAWASSLEKGLATREEGKIRLSTPEATTIAELLDELSAVYPAEPLGTLARRLSVLLWDRLGI
jgi:hypothetical protein